MPERCVSPAYFSAALSMFPFAILWLHHGTAIERLAACECGRVDLRLQVPLRTYQLPTLTTTAPIAKITGMRSAKRTTT